MEYEFITLNFRPPGSRFDPFDPFGQTGRPDPDHQSVPGRNGQFGFPGHMYF